MNLATHIQRTLHNRRAQLLLPAVLLLPLFVLVIYLLVEVTKVSIAKVRHQFALDNAAYTQMTTVSVFLNAVGVLNGPLPFRVLKTYEEKLKVVTPENPYRDSQNWTVFDLFFQAGAVPTIGPDYDKNAKNNPPPKQESVDWGVHYAKYDGIEQAVDDEGNPLYERSDWEKETPAEIKGPVYVMNQEMVSKHYIAAKKVGLPAIMAYLNTYVQVGDTFNLQKCGDVPGRIFLKCGRLQKEGVRTAECVAPGAIFIHPHQTPRGRGYCGICVRFRYGGGNRRRGQNSVENERSWRGTVILLCVCRAHRAQPLAFLKTGGYAQTKFPASAQSL